MKRFARFLLVTVGFGVLGFVMSLVPQKSATGAGSAPVNIMSPLPLPVTGSVNANITNSSAVPVSVSNTPTVNANVTFPSALTGASVPVNLKQLANFKTLLNEGTGYNEVQPDGTVNPSAFAIPPGEQFVITDVSWVIECFLRCTVVPSPGDAAGFALGNGPVYLSIDAFRNTLAGPLAGHADHLTSGIVVTQLPAPSILGAPTGEVFEVTLQGYLVP